MRAVVVFVVTVVASGYGLVTGFKTEPVKAAWSGLADPEDGVSQVLTCCWDELDSASGSYVELFQGDTGTGSQYKVDVYDYPGGVSRVAYNLGRRAIKPQSWVRMPLTIAAGKSFTKGKLYEFRFTRSGSDSIQYYYDEDCGYGPYGQMIAPYPPPSLTTGLAMRCFGRMKPGSDVWRACVNHGNDPPGDSAEAALVKADSIGITWLRDDFDQMWQWEDTRAPAMGIYHRCENRFNLLGILCYGSDDTAKSSRGHEPSDTIYWPAQYPPRNLFKSVYSDSNWWARNCWSIMESMPKVKHWEVWPEANALWGMRNPDVAHYWGSGGPGDTINTPRERCSLYVRMCCIAESVAHELGGDTLRKVIGGGTWRITDPTASGSPGVDWLQDMLDLAEHHYGGVQNCFDIASVHPYMDYPDNREFHFLEDVFDTGLDTARVVMRAAGYPDMELWATEYGWPRYKQDEPDSILTDTLVQADNVCKFYTSAIGRQADPRGGYDRAFHYELTGLHHPGGDNQGFGFLAADSAQDRLPHSWAFEQLDSLVGKRFNRSVLVGDSETGTRVYEFEDTTAQKIRTWVCWSDSLSTAIVAPVPVRSDTADTLALDYDGSESKYQKDAEDSGWLDMRLQERPVFITEKGVASRPEIVTDSVWIVSPSLRPQVNTPVTFCALLRNRDTLRSTPSGCSTWVRFAWNDSTICYTCTAESLGAGETLTVSVYDTVPPGMHGEGLLKADANPGMLYVEKEGTDDNQAYLRLDVLYPPSGGMDVVVPPPRKTPAPLLPIGMTSVSWESDTTGQTPADSARILFAWYGQKDTVVHATDTTAWFPFCADTTLAFPRGSGVFRVYAQFRDSGENDSPFYPDSIDSIIVFDTTGPSGSVVINSGSRFTPSSTCTLTLAAYDSTSGVGWTRLMNRPRVDLTENGGFSASLGSWTFTNGGAYDTSLALAKLSAGSPQAGVRQFVPAESISAYSGDSCVLEASILAHVHEDDAAGGVSYWFYSIREDSLNFHDTLWELVDSACYSGELLSLTGRNGLSKHFLLEEPAPESGWVWRGGMVRVDANSENGTGSVWADNVRIVPYQSGSGYSWWNGYDTLVQWELESGAGMKAVHALFLDSAGNENATPYADTIILDPTAPVVSISLPEPGQYVGGMVEVTGFAYDPVEVPGDTWFSARRLYYRHVDSTNWLPVLPDSCSSEPAYPDSEQILGPAVHLGYWCTDSVPDGEYYLKLVGTDSAGHVSSCSTWVIVFNSGGGGNFCGGPEGGGSGVGEGSCYVGSATGHVLHLSDDLALLDTFAVADSGSQANVTAILEVGNDSLLVLDAANKRIHKLHKNGQHRRRLVSNLSQPMDLKRDANGNLYLVDKGWHRIGKFRSNGTLAFVRGGLGSDSLHFHSPEGIAVKSSLVYVADGGNNRVAVWDTSGNFKTIITGDFESPTAVLPTDSGTIYLTDGSDGKLKGITPLGGNIVAIGTSDSSKLRGLVLNENEHSLFSIAPQPNRVYKLRIRSDESIPGGPQSAGNVKLPKTLSLAQPFPNPARTRLNIAYALPHQTQVVLKLYDVAGKLVTTLANGEQKPGYYSLTWNRQDAKGRSCACGVYFCTLSADDKRFSRKVILTE